MTSQNRAAPRRFFGRGGRSPEGRRRMTSAARLGTGGDRSPSTVGRPGSTTTPLRGRPSSSGAFTPHHFQADHQHHAPLAVDGTRRVVLAVGGNPSTPASARSDIVRGSGTWFGQELRGYQSRSYLWDDSWCSPQAGRKASAVPAAKNVKKKALPGL